MKKDECLKTGIESSIREEGRFTLLLSDGKSSVLTEQAAVHSSYHKIQNGFKTHF